MTTDSTGDLVRLLLAIADSIEQRDATASAGICRVAAARLVALESQSRVGRAREGSSCPWCGRAVEQPSTGRKRVYCSASCRRAAGFRLRRGGGPARAGGKLGCAVVRHS